MAIGSFAVADDASQINILKSTLKSVPTAELPAKVATAVAQSKSQDRQTATVHNVKAAVSLRPGATPAIVGAISRAAPDMAAVAAGVAAAEQPNQVVFIARAAAGAAPAKVTDIVAAICRAVPNQYRNIATAVAQLLPGASKEILAGIAAAIPALKTPIESAVAKTSLSTLSVAGVLDRATLPTPTASAQVAPPVFQRGPSVQAPYIPLSGTPTNIDNGGSGTVPPGGRDYSRPL